ncbi:DUF3630 family protein [Pelagibius sp. CAU 1746]|uniref:DUF3630 family protein n=1 Tax=Pelagibius sp. CAU 1746 TaxID=3140370 RepID=UPI00325B35A3
MVDTAAEQKEMNPANGPDGPLWRLARLHPGLVMLFYFAAGFGGALWDEMLQRTGAVAQVLTGPVVLLLLQSYPLFVILLVSGRFASSSPRGLRLPVAAFIYVGIGGLFVLLVGYLVTGSAYEVPTAARYVAGSMAALFGVAWFYLWIAASVRLLEAEKGLYYGGLQAFGTFLLFLYLPFFGAFFLHRRIRSLVRRFEYGDPMIVNPPLEALKIERQAGGHLSLLLTERMVFEDFGRYAEELMRRLDGKVTEKGYAAGMHIWNVKIETLPFRLVYDEFPNGVTLESESHAGDMLLSKLQKRLTHSA